MEKSVKAYSATWMAVVVFLVVMSALITRTAVSDSSTAIEPRLLLVLVGLLLVVLGNYMPKTGSNWFFGFRTPWTLSNEDVWTATHTIGGPILVAVGVLSALAAIILPIGWAVGTGIVLPLAAIAGLTVYSYVKYRQLTTV